jgi:putative transposase
MDKETREQVALHRYGVIAEALGHRLTGAERGRIVREIAGRNPHTPRRDPTPLLERNHRPLDPQLARGGLCALKPDARADAGGVRAHPELIEEVCKLRLERPDRSAAQIARMIYYHHGIAVAERTVRAQLRRRGLDRKALSAQRRVFGRYEAERANERWVTDVLVGPWVPHPRQETSVRAKLFLIVDDRSRLLVDGVFYAHENARACQDLLRRAITHRGVPDVLYADYADLGVMPTSRRTSSVTGVSGGELSA